MHGKLNIGDKAIIPLMGKCGFSSKSANVSMQPKP